jgi:LysM repeat protein
VPLKSILRSLFFLALLAVLIYPVASVFAYQSPVDTVQADQVTAFDLIVAMNTLRTSNGLPALVEDPIIDAVAQTTAETMAANNMSSHIGDVSGRLAAAGFGGGSKVWGTENFAAGNYASIDQIMLVWSDAAHMIPAVQPAYCNIGAGVAKASNGFTYYILQAAYTAGKSCGEYIFPPGGITTNPSGSTNNGRVPGVSQLIVPVKIATPDADGKVFHVVQAGQSFWSIAIAYKITIKDLETWNNLSRDFALQIGQRLFIPTSNTKGYATPTPVGMIQISTPDQDGKVIHVVQVYQTLSTIAEAYGVNVNTILALNGIQVDWPLQIGQKLVIQPSSVTPSPTARPLTPLEKLTPASDGKYYHIIKSGETLSWIAKLYEVNLADLMAWNGLDDSSILYPNQKLLLLVTPPATKTPTSSPVTITSTATAWPSTPTPTPTPVPTQAIISPTSPVDSPFTGGRTIVGWSILIGLALGGSLLVWFNSRKKY